MARDNDGRRCRCMHAVRLVLLWMAGLPAGLMVSHHCIETSSSSSSNGGVSLFPLLCFPTQNPPYCHYFVSAPFPIISTKGAFFAFVCFVFFDCVFARAHFLNPSHPTYLAFPLRTLEVAPKWVFAEELVRAIARKFDLNSTYGGIVTWDRRWLSCFSFRIILKLLPVQREDGQVPTDRQTDGLEFQLINHKIRLTPPGQTDG